MPFARASLAKGKPKLDISPASHQILVIDEDVATRSARVLPGLKGEFMTFVLSANRGAGDAVPIKKAPIDVIKVIVKAFMASSSRA
jgi:hypothetical protein